MTPYRQGVRLEYLARDILLQEGYTVIRSAGSKGPVDLVAFNHNQILFIQVKAAGQNRPADLEKLSQITIPPCAQMQVWERAGRGWKIQNITRE